VQLSRQRADLQPGNYVRVYGHLSRFDNDVHVKAYAVKPVNDKDEVGERVCVGVCVCEGGGGASVQVPHPVHLPLHGSGACRPSMLLACTAVPSRSLTAGAPHTQLPLCIVDLLMLICSPLPLPAAQLTHSPLCFLLLC
jgi:hypothetical protein